MTRPQRQTVRLILTRLKAIDPDIEAHSGDCEGADEEFNEEATAIGAKTVGHPPTDPKKRAWCKFDVTLDTFPYLIRNGHIVDVSRIMIATPGEFEEQLRSGTWGTIRKARKAKKHLIIVWPDGTYEGTLGTA